MATQPSEPKYELHETTVHLHRPSSTRPEEPLTLRVMNAIYNAGDKGVAYDWLVQNFAQSEPEITPEQLENIIRTTIDALEHQGAVQKVNKFFGSSKVYRFIGPKPRHHYGRLLTEKPLE